MQGRFAPNVQKRALAEQRKPELMCTWLSCLIAEVFCLGCTAGTLLAPNIYVPIPSNGTGIVQGIPVRESAP